MDLLSDVLQAVRLAGAFFYRVEATAPWCVEAPSSAALLPHVRPEAEHLIPYHVVVTGACWGWLLDVEPVLVRAGDVIVMPHGDAHGMGSAPRLRPTNAYQPPSPRLPLPVSVGTGAGEHVSTLVCGFLACDRQPFNPLLTALPRLLHMQGGIDGWLTRFAQQAADEATSTGSGARLVLTRLSELMFIEVVRRHVDSLGAGSANWLAGLRDPFVGRALSALHASPERPWTLADLARESALSRSALAERFTQFVGEPPMQYLTRWRMQLAARTLSNPGTKVSAVAAAVGYDSEAAFSRAFKKVVGVSPALWRTRQSAAEIGMGA